jgi:hypothetical protein
MYNISAYNMMFRRRIETAPHSIRAQLTFHCKQCIVYASVVDFLRKPSTLFSLAAFKYMSARSRQFWSKIDRNCQLKSSIMINERY